MSARHRAQPKAEQSKAAQPKAAQPKAAQPKAAQPRGTTSPVPSESPESPVRPQRSAANVEAPARPARQSGRLWQRDWRGAPAITVFVLAALGLLFVAATPRHWLRGVLLMALAMGLAAVFRVVLPARNAGLLVVRSRVIDAIWYAGVAAAMLILGLWLRASGRT